MIDNWFAYAERRVYEYGAVVGQRTRIRTKEQPEVSEVFWLLGQEHDCLILGQEPRTPEGTRRRITFLNTASVIECEALADDESTLDATGLALSIENARFVQARVAIHALTPSGSRALLEITGVEPFFGGYFPSPNAAFGFALNHLHGELQDAGILPPGDLPLRDRYWEVSSVGHTALLRPDEVPAASLLIQVAEMPQDKLAALTVPTIGERAGKALGSVDRLRAWAYEGLCQQAANSRILPADYRPRIRYSRLS